MHRECQQLERSCKVDHLPWIHICNNGRGLAYLTGCYPTILWMEVKFLSCTSLFCLSFFSMLLKEWNLQACYSLVLREDASFAITPSIALPTEDFVFLQCCRKCIRRICFECSDVAVLPTHFILFLTNRKTAESDSFVWNFTELKMTNFCIMYR